MVSNGGCCFRKEGREGLPDKVIPEQGSGQNGDGGGEQDIRLLGKNVPDTGIRRYKALEIGMLRDNTETSGDGVESTRSGFRGWLRSTTGAESQETLGAI